MGNVARFGKRPLHENYISATTYILSYHRFIMWNFLKRVELSTNTDVDDDGDDSSKLSLNNNDNRFIQNNVDNVDWKTIQKFKTNSNKNIVVTSTNRSSFQNFFGVNLKTVNKNNVNHDERDAIQKKTFTKWVNKHLIKVTKGVVDLFEDIRDGNNLISLLEVLSGETLPREKGKLRVHHLQNVRTCLQFLKNRNIKLVNIRADDIVDGNPKLTLGLIWTIILHFQLSDIILYDDTISFKEALLKWARKTTQGYPGVNVTDFTHSWKDGLAFNAILHRNRPDLLDYRSCRSRTAIENLENAFTIAENDLGVTKLLDPEDVYCPNPDEKSLITYISSLYELFPEPPENNPLLDKERIKRIEEYKTAAKRLVKWIDESCHRLSDRNFSPSLEEMKRIQEETYRFRSEEIPPRFKDKQHLCESYKQILEMALALPVRIDEEIKPDSIEQRWKEMLLAYQERDRDIKDYMSRLEDLEHLANKLRKNIRECDKKLTDIEYAIVDLQKRIQHSTTTEPTEQAIEQIQKELKFEEKRLNMMINDANYLIDQHYPEARDLYEQVKLLHERYQALNLEFNERIFGALQDKSIQKIHQVFADYVSALLEKLREQERKIVKKLQEPIPRRVQDIDRLAVEHKEFEIETRQFEPDVEKVKREYSKLPTRNAGSQSKFETLMELWQNIWKYSDSYVQQMDAIRIILLDINDATNMICELEIALSSSPDMSSEIDKARAVFDDLRRIHSKVIKHESSFEKLLSNVSKIRNIVERNRPHRTASHPDIDQLERDVKILNRRWKDIATQAMERIKSLETCTELLNAYRTKMCKEIEWMKRMNQNVDDFVRRKELKNAKQLYEEASSHKISIEETNHLGARFMKEAKIYDLKLKNYREKIEEYHPSVDAAAKRSKIIGGIDCVEQELKQLNDDYASLLNRILGLLNQLQDDDSKLREFPTTVTIKTYEQFPGINSIIKSHNSTFIFSNNNNNNNNNNDDDNNNSNRNSNNVMIDEDDTIDSQCSTTTISFTNQCHPSPTTIEATLQKYHHKITTATVSNVPLSDLHECKSLNISTLNLTQDIQSKETDDNITEITVNRIYETDVQNKTFILKKSQPLQHNNESESFSINVDGDKPIDDMIMIDRYEPIARLSCSSDIHHQISRAFIDDISSTPIQSKETDVYFEDENPIILSTNLSENIPYDVINTTSMVMAKPSYYSEPPIIINKSMKTISEIEFLSTQPDEQQQQQQTIEPNYYEHFQLPTNELDDDNNFSKINTDNIDINKPFSTSFHFDSVPVDFSTSFPLTISENANINVPLESKEHYPLIQHELADEFLHWLNQKEKIIKKLEPICSEPQKLIAQLQQTQQLTEEFVAHSPMLNKIDKFADSLMERLDRTDSQFRSIQEKQQSIHDKWNKLTNILAEREKNLLAVKDAANEFQNKYDRLLAALHKISDDFDNIVDSGADGDEQLLKLSHLEESLEAQRPNIADCDRSCQKLCELLTDNGSKNEVRGRVDGLRKFYDDLSQKISDKKAELQLALKEDKDFFFNCNAIQDWLRNMQNRLLKEFKVSAIHEKLLKQVDQFEPLYREVLDKEHEIHILIQKGDELQRGISRPSDQNQIRTKMDQLKRQYNQLKDEATVQHTKLQKCLDISTKYRNAFNAFMPWLTQAENRLKQFEGLVLTKQHMEKMLREIQALKSDISRHSSDFETICSLGESLISTADIDTEVIREQLNELKKRWNNLQREVENKLKEVEQLLQKLNIYDDKAGDLNHGLNRLDDKLNQLSHKDPKQLEKLESLMDDSKKLADDLDKLKKVGFKIIDEAGPDADSAPIRDGLKNFDDRYNTLNNNLADRHRSLQKASGAMQKFNNDLSAIQKDLNALEEKLDKMAPIGRKIQVVQMQIEEMKEFNGKLSKVYDNLKEADRTCDDLIAKGFASDPIGTRNQLDNLHRKYERIKERGENRLKNLDDVLDQLKQFNDLINQNMRSIKDLLKEIDNFKPISRDVETIRSQQRELQSFVQNRVEPLKQQVDEVNRCGNELIQSASHGVDVGQVEKDLEKQNETWNNLKAKVQEREKSLEAAFLQAGRFEDALRNVEKWLSETEEMVAKQKPPSSDYVALKAQIQEQKYLKKTLTDRQESIDNLQELGRALMNNLDRAERNQIEKQLADVNRRFNRLFDSCNERMKMLDDILPLAKEFSEKIVPLQEWLESSVRKLTTLQAFSIEPNKLNRRISEHQSFHQEVVGKQKDFKNLSNIAQRLIHLIRSDDEGKLIADKLSEVIEKYAKLVEDSDELQKTLHDASKQIVTFLANFDKHSKWINEMESKLQKHKILNVHLDKLRDQLDDVENIHRNVDSYQREIAEFVTHGQQLAKQYSTNDSMFIRQKVESIQNKFNDLTQMASDKLEQIRASLNLAQKFYAAFDELNEWMKMAENKLNQIDSYPISQQNEIIDSLESDVTSKRRLLDTINNLGNEFARTSPGQGASTINGYVSKCNKRFDAIIEQLQRKSEKLRLMREQNESLNIDIDELFDWFRDAERQLLEAEPITSNYDQLLILLREVKSLNDDINQQKLRVREIVNKVKKLMRDSTTANDELININNKTDELKELANNVAQLCQDRLNSIEHALPLVEHFFDTHNEIVQFLDEIENEVQILSQPSIYVEQIRKQQETTKRLIQSLKSNKPLFERLNKTGDELIGLLQKKSDIHQIKQIMDDDNERYNRLKNALRQRQNDLENALQATSLFTDKLDGMLNALNNTADQLKNAEPISAHVPKIKEQIGDNNAILDDLKKREDAFNAVKNNAKEIISKAGRSDEPAIRDIKNKLDRLNDLWNDINRMANERGDCLDDALKLAKQFWNELNDVIRAIKDLEDALESQEPPAIEPDKIQRQQHILSEIKHDMDRTRPRLEQCKQVGKNLIKVCGEPDRPEVRKQMEDLDSAWDNVTSLYAKREKNLIDAMEKAMEFHEKMRNLLKFLDDAENKFDKLGPIAADIDEVKKQIQELKNFKNWVDPHMVDVEALNRMAHELLDRVPSHQAKGIRDAINDINKRWKNLLKNIGDRKSDLDNALLKLGQFQHSLNELLAWIDKIEKILDEGEKIYADPQVIEVELAKHKVLLNDINAHQANVDALNQVGRHLIDSEMGSENARNTKAKLNHLNSRWNTLIDKANGHTNELEECLRKSQSLAQEIQDMMAWLNEMDQLISTSKPVGGLPETAREQLNRFMEIYNELDMNRHKVETLLQNGHDYVSKAKEGQAVHLQQNLKNLQNKWENILNRANDRKIKLEIALKEATEFHEALQEFVDWLTSAEKYLASLQPVSRVLEHVLKQIEEHKQFQKDIGLHRETMLNLDKKGTHLKYFSQKQDVILIKNLLSSVQLRWEKVLTKTAERARNLDHGFKEAKEFHDSWSDLITWLDDAERTLDSIEPMGNNPDLIKQTLYRHKEFQRQLGGKQSNYDSTMRFGKSLKDKAPKDDGPILQEMLDELKNKWNAVCQKSVDKQRKLEEALLFSGQFKDAIQALIEWLEKAKQILAFDQPVHGDLDTVNTLIDDHRNFIDDFKSREKNMQFVRKTAADLMKSANADDARQIGRQMETLEEKWAEIEKMMQQKQLRLDDALKLANQLHKAVHTLLGWLSDAELKLRFAGPLPDNEDVVQQQIREHENFIREMQQKEREKNSTLDLANDILRLSHPNALPVIKHWITIIQSRWDEVESWGRQREKRLNDQLKSMKDASELLNNLDQWLATTESNLNELESQPLPDEIIELEKLNDDHQRLIDDLNDKKVDVEFIIKTYSSKKPSSASKDRSTSSKHRLYGVKMPKAQFEPEINNPKANHMLDKWHSVWRLVSDRMKRLKDGLNYNREMEKMKNFDFEEWRKRFLFFNDHRKAKLMDFFKRIDRDNDGRVSKSEFINGVLNSRFTTNRLEMENVADIFDINGDRYIDQKEYLDTLRPDKGDGAGQSSKTESEIIQDEVQRLADQCTCVERYKVYRIDEGKYRFGDSQKLRLVRILRSTVMVRVGGGWVSLSDFLLKHDPCRAKGRTNVELREQFVLADSVRGQSMTPFKSKSPFQSDGSITMTGPISKIREKTERSMPMSQTYRYGGSSGDHTNNEDQEDLFRSRSRTRMTPSNSRPTSRSGSYHSSSQPPSRAGSDMSTGSLEGYKLGPRKKSGLNGSTIGRPTTSSFNRASSFTKQSSPSPIGPRWNI
ncbi:microtubule-actin cross-linking factor 1-like protein [Dermatophagoides farinae]|uniref:Microtubule-actin cross-linking factor 1-like protein n=1 Tax=Dermatophagoides farinae TaxID=6954 RepID=A0A9D4SL43_DERFA|nr:microtubule-actin cross-linking factor 1-like protein [Dermatophagoides farinae]